MNKAAAVDNEVCSDADWSGIRKGHSHNHADKERKWLRMSTDKEGKGLFGNREKWWLCQSHQPNLIPSKKVTTWDHRRDFDAFVLFGVEYDFCPKITGQTHLDFEASLKKGQTHQSKSPGTRTVRFRFLVPGESQITGHSKNSYPSESHRNFLKRARSCRTGPKVGRRLFFGRSSGDSHVTWHHYLLLPVNETCMPHKLARSSEPLATNEMDHTSNNRCNQYCCGKSNKTANWNDQWPLRRMKSQTKWSGWSGRHGSTYTGCFWFLLWVECIISDYELTIDSRSLIRRDN